ncbi:MAG: phosphotransferase [Pseudomonadota bacterium]
MSKHATSSAEDLLKSKNWIPAGANIVSITIAGAGNMNLVERVRFDTGESRILKRARGWVEKYPDIPAPIERAGVEAAFYQSVKGSVAGAGMPTHLAYDEPESANLLQDLGEGTDGMFVYGEADLPISQLNAVADWVSSLHEIPVTDSMRNTFRNAAMRELNALHIFNFPLDAENGLELDQLTPGLQAAADELKRNEHFVGAVKEVEDWYQRPSSRPGDVLLHGDLYPGSWLTNSDGLYVIDPEFCWIGPAEWDIGVLLAHLRLSDQPPDLSAAFLERYGRPVDEVLLKKITGIEMMRRIIGVAQLPLDIDLARKKSLLEEAYWLVTGRRTTVSP